MDSREKFEKWMEELPTNLNSYTKVGFALAAWNEARKQAFIEAENMGEVNLFNKNRE